MNKKLLSVSLLLVGLQSYSQVGIGTLTPNQSAQLDVVSNNKGILIPRVGLTSSKDASTIQKGNVNSLLVFNTNTQNDVTPGYYYWYDDRWMRIVNDADVVALDKNTTNKSLTVVGGDLVLTDSDGNMVSIPLSAINTATSVVTYQGSQYYLSEEYIQNGGSSDPSTWTSVPAGATLIDVVGTVITNIQNQGDIYSEIINILEQESDLFVDNGDGTFTHTAVDGTVMTFDANTLDMVNNNDGTYTFTNANGETLTVDVVGDVVTNIQNQGDIYSEIINVIAAEESLTAMTQDVNTGVITYTPERGAATTANVVSADSGNEITVGSDGGAFYQAVNTVRTISKNYSIVATDDTVLIDGASGDIAVTLPVASENNGRIIILRKMDGTGSIVTLSEQVILANGVTFTQFNVQGTMRIQSNGTNWYKID